MRLYHSKSLHFPFSADMDCNRDEAEKCYGLALKALRAKKIEKATEYLTKAQRMYPSRNAQGEFHHL